jgi:hypothetical protein
MKIYIFLASLEAGEVTPPHEFHAARLRAGCPGDIAARCYNGAEQEVLMLDARVDHLEAHAAACGATISAKANG